MTRRKPKAALRTQTQVTETALQTAYDSASTKLNAVIGSLGKQAAKLRSAIRTGPLKASGTAKPT